mmetsp:Transcript_7772/g.19240  ORF Transcript_7772/g.19240 Transcript_7772/m.19240 type:complete len:285 (+) Transcript_7772:1325-2179(+)
MTRARRSPPNPRRRRLEPLSRKKNRRVTNRFREAARRARISKGPRRILREGGNRRRRRRRRRWRSIPSSPGGSRNGGPRRSSIAEAPPGGKLPKRDPPPAAAHPTRSRTIRRPTANSGVPPEEPLPNRDGTRNPSSPRFPPTRERTTTLLLPAWRLRPRRRTRNGRGGKNLPAPRRRMRTRTSRTEHRRWWSSAKNAKKSYPRLFARAEKTNDRRRRGFVVEGGGRRWRYRSAISANRRTRSKTTTILSKRTTTTTTTNSTNTTATTTTSTSRSTIPKPTPIPC